jgi:hypothetical protein
MSDLMLNLSIAISAGALFLFAVLMLDCILHKRFDRQRSNLFTEESRQNYQELEVSKN